MLTLFEEKQLFDNGKNKTIHFDIPDAELTLRERFFEKEESDVFYEALLHNTPWQQHQRKMYDKFVLDPRLTAWYGTNGHAWTPELSIIRKRVEAVSGIIFNGVLLNYYRDGKDSVSWHSDKNFSDTLHLPIASVSFGATRPFRLRHKYRKDIKPFEIPLTHGSFLLMAGPMQEFWEHHIPKTSKSIAPRINLTFRIRE